MDLKFKKTMKYLLVALMPLMMYSCQQDLVEPRHEGTKNLEQLAPSAYQALPAEVQQQLDLSRENLTAYMGDDLQIVDLKLLGEIDSEEMLRNSRQAITDPSTVIAFGNIKEPATVQINRMQEMYTGSRLSETQNNLRAVADKEIQKGDRLLEISWKKGDETFTTQAVYRNTGLVWDNVLSGLVMMERQEITEDNSNRANKLMAYSSWYKEWWTAKWLWGSDRGEMGYKITIHYTGSTVSSTDVQDWGYISLGSAKSYSKIVKNSGSYGKCQYALGMATPTGSLSFSYSTFQVSFSGLGSNIVANGYKSRYP
jgi:hypothetical protein